MIANLEPHLIDTKPEVDPEEIAGLENFLLANPGWWSSSRLLAARGIVPDQNNRKELTHIAEWCDRIISGQEGYCHINHASADEIKHFLNGLDSRSRKLAERRLRVSKAAHQKIA